MKVTCTKCPKTFDKPNRLAADQALRMHVARVHDHTLIAPHEHSGVVRMHTNGKTRSKLSPEEVQEIVGFIQTRRETFPSKQACFTAALEHAGVEKKIVNNSVAVQRYFEKAESAAPVKVKRKYTKRNHKPVQHDIHVNFCPNCGCNIHAVAVGMATALVEK